MKRIAAVAALAVTMLAVPAAAMASTGGSGSGSDGPWQGSNGCQTYYPYQHRYGGDYANWGFRHHRHHRNQFCGFSLSQQPATGTWFQPSCSGDSFVYNMASGSSSGYEVSGPTLTAGEQYAYNDSFYTVATVDGSRFTITGVVYGPDIDDATANIC